MDSSGKINMLVISCLALAILMTVFYTSELYRNIVYKKPLKTITDSVWHLGLYGSLVISYYTKNSWVWPATMVAVTVFRLAALTFLEVNKKKLGK